MNNQTAERFHDLDALRAFAMIMGILFHAAWMFMPQFFYYPYPDAAATEWLSYFFYASHTYRMQLFFLVAGFFACMMIQKRGVTKFVSNRLSRIGIPFIVFGAILIPLISYQYNLGARQDHLRPVSCLIDSDRTRELDTEHNTHIAPLVLVLPPSALRRDAGNTLCIETAPSQIQACRPIAHSIRVHL